MMKRFLFLCLGLLVLTSCSDPSKPDGTGYTSVNYSEPVEGQCPYCSGTGMIYSWYGPQYCSNCNGKGTVVNISFKSKTVRTLKKNVKCPNKSTTFECIDEHNNGIISSTDKCIHCDHMYYVHGN